MNNLQSKSKVLLLTAAAIVNCISGHAFLSDPLARNGGNNIRKITPRPVSAANLNSCPGSTPGPIAKTYTAGDTINVAWTITVGHANAPGVRLALAESPDGPFTELASGLDINDESAAITLPAGVTCTNCVMHWLWDSAGDGGYYIGCADIAITAAEAAEEPEPVVAEEQPVVEEPAAEEEAVVVAEEEPIEVQPEPVQETPVVEAPAEEVPVVETPVEETPVIGTPAEEVPVVETPAEEEPVEEVTESMVGEAKEVAEEAEEVAVEVEEALNENAAPVATPTTTEPKAPKTAPANKKLTRRQRRKARRARRKARRKARRAARKAARKAAKAAAADAKN